MRNKNTPPQAVHISSSSPPAPTKATPPSNNNKNIGSNKIESHSEEETAEDFPVVECSYDSLLDHDESEDEDKISARLRQNAVKIQQINDELHNIDDAERELEMEEMISIYDSYVKHGADEIPDDDAEENNMNMVLMTGNLSERINALRQYCVEGLGQQKFERVYALMNHGSGTSSGSNMEHDHDNHYNANDDLESMVENIIGSEKMDYFNYIRQIIFCEHSLQ